jgi:hypothetical protein
MLDRPGYCTAVQRFLITDYHIIIIIIIQLSSLSLYESYEEEFYFLTRFNINIKYSDSLFSGRPALITRKSSSR